MSAASNIWNKKKSAIICDFESGLSNFAIAKKYGLSNPTIKEWRKRVDFEVMPPAPPDKMAMRAEVDLLPTKRFLEEQGSIVETTEVFKVRGMRFLNMALDRMEELLETTKDIRAIAAGLNVIMPYLLARVDGDGDMGGSLEARRNAFIQNVQNNYNIKINKDETIENIGNNRNSTKPAAGNE